MSRLLCFFFFFNATATTEIYTFPYTTLFRSVALVEVSDTGVGFSGTDSSRLFEAFHTTKARSEEHTSELQSHSDLVCRLLLEKKKIEVHSEVVDHELYVLAQ